MPLVMPLRIIRHPESFEVRDSEGRNIAFIYFEDETARRNAMRRLTEAEARGGAQKIARALSAP